MCLPTLHLRKGVAKYPIGTRGSTLLFASGDLGVGDGNPDPKTQVCLTNDGKNNTRFMPTFPATYVCPFKSLEPNLILRLVVLCKLSLWLGL